MMGNANKDWNSFSDLALIRQIGAFVKKRRLDNNLTQAEVAHNAGVNRVTLGKLERGESITLVSLIQILRVLELLKFMDSFIIDDQISPIEYARIKEKERKRARNTGEKQDSHEELEW